MSGVDLDAIRARCEVATPGPWEHKREIGDSGAPYDPICVGRYRVVDDVGLAVDAAFIAHAREDVPALLAEVERLRAAVEEARGRTRVALTLLDAGATVERIRHALAPQLPAALAGAEPAEAPATGIETPEAMAERLYPTPSVHALSEIALSSNAHVARRADVAQQAAKRTALGAIRARDEQIRKALLAEAAGTSAEGWARAFAAKLGGTR